MARHVHADLIEEWLNDVSIKWQRKYPVESDDEYRDIEGGPAWHPDLHYRKKPREFKEGHWYPMTDKEDDSCVKLFSDDAFHSYDNLESPYPVDEFKWIGESLGKLKFG